MCPPSLRYPPFARSPPLARFPPLARRPPSSRCLSSPRTLLRRPPREWWYLRKFPISLSLPLLLRTTPIRRLTGLLTSHRGRLGWNTFTTSKPATLHPTRTQPIPRASSPRPHQPTSLHTPPHQAGKSRWASDVWTEHTSAKDGRSYTFNTLTGEAHPLEPAASTQAVLPTESPSVDQPAGEPSSWTSHISLAAHDAKVWCATGALEA